MSRHHVCLCVDGGEGRSLTALPSNSQNRDVSPQILGYLFISFWAPPLVAVPRSSFQLLEVQRGNPRQGTMNHSSSINTSRLYLKVQQGSSLLSDLPSHSLPSFLTIQALWPFVLKHVKLSLSQDASLPPSFALFPLSRTFFLELHMANSLSSFKSQLSSPFWRPLLTSLAKAAIPHP